MLNDASDQIVPVRTARRRCGAAGDGARAGGSGRQFSPRLRTGRRRPVARAGGGRAARTGRARGRHGALPAVSVAAGPGHGRARPGRHPDRSLQVGRTAHPVCFSRFAVLPRPAGVLRAPPGAGSVERRLSQPGRQGRGGRARLALRRPVRPGAAAVRSQRTQHHRADRATAPGRQADRPLSRHRHYRRLPGVCAGPEVRARAPALQHAVQPDGAFGRAGAAGRRQRRAGAAGGRGRAAIGMQAAAAARNVGHGRLALIRFHRAPGARSAARHRHARRGGDAAKHRPQRAGHQERRDGGCHHQPEVMHIAERLLQVAADHAGHHHAQPHQTGAERVVRGAVFTGRQLLHQINHEAHRTEAIEEFFNGHAGADQPQAFRLVDAHQQERDVGDVDRAAQDEQRGRQAAPRHENPAQQRAHQHRDQAPDVALLEKGHERIPQDHARFGRRPGRVLGLGAVRHHAQVPQGGHDDDGGHDEENDAPRIDPLRAELAGRVVEVMGVQPAAQVHHAARSDDGPHVPAQALDAAEQRLRLGVERGHVHAVGRDVLRGAHQRQQAEQEHHHHHVVGQRHGQRHAGKPDAHDHLGAQHEEFLGAVHFHERRKQRLDGVGQDQPLGTHNMGVPGRNMAASRDGCSAPGAGRGGFGGWTVSACDGCGICRPRCSLWGRAAQADSAAAPLASGACRRSHLRPSGGSAQFAVGALLHQVVAVPDGAALERALLGRIVHVDDAEALGVARVPFEVVEQAPQEVTLDVHALQAGVVDGFQVAQHEVDAGVVRHFAVDDAVGVGHAVFRDVDRRQVVVGVQLEQQFGQAVRVDFPAHVGGAQRARGLDRRHVGAAERAEVIVQAHEVELALDDGEVAVLHVRRVVAVDLERQRRVVALEDRVHEPFHRTRVFKLGHGNIGRAVGGGVGRPLVQHDAELGRAAHVAHGAHGQAVRQQQVVRDLDRLLDVRHAGGELGIAVAEVGRAPWLVVRCNRFQAIAEAARHFRCVLGKTVGRFTVEPAAVFFQALRQIPVVQRDVGVDVLAFQFGQQAVVEGKARFVPGAFAQRLHARPGDRKAVGVHAQAGHDGHVFRVAVVMVARDVAVGAVDDFTGRMAEGIPDRRSLAVGGGAALDLERAGGNAPGRPSAGHAVRPDRTPHPQLCHPCRPAVDRAGARAGRAGPAIPDRLRQGAARLRPGVRPPGAHRAGDRFRHGRHHGPHRRRHAGQGFYRRGSAHPGRGQPAQADRRAGTHQPQGHPARRGRGAEPHDSRWLAAWRAHLLPRPVAQGAPQQAPPDPGAVRQAAGAEAGAGRLPALRHRLGRLRRADAGSVKCGRGFAEHGRRLRAATGVPAADQVRKPWHQARSRRVGPGVQQALTVLRAQVPQCRAPSARHCVDQGGVETL
uniref:Uncharacterized protein n=1 Tax=Tanacetum cinerariifolium TaxID=118510 RepID=A0A699GDU3_TANCI|nr:hypothetical protein [Tanacetum cinerariifolium]